MMRNDELKNKDPLENKIKTHADEIFGQGKNPPEGHRTRFEQRLKAFRTQSEPFVPLLLENALPTGAVVTPPLSESALPSRTAATGHDKEKVSWQKRRYWMAAVASAAALLAGAVWLLYEPAKTSGYPAVADVRNYYDMQLEEQVDATKQLMQTLDEAHRDVLLANIERIEEAPIPQVQLTDDEYIVFLADVYTNKIERLQNMQEVIKENN